MANLLSSIGDYIKMTAWDQPAGIIKNVAKGDFGGAFDEWKGTFGDNNRGEQEIAHSLGIRGWVGDHPTETAAAVVGTILGGWMAAGAYGGAAAGAGTAAAGSAGTAAGAAGTTAGVGAGTTAGLGAGTTATGAGVGTLGGAGTFSPAFLSAQGAATAAGTGTGAATATPATSALIGMGNAGVGASSATAGSSVFTPAMLTTQGAAASGGTFGAASAPASTSALGTVPAASSGPASGATSSFDMQDFIQNMQRLNNAVNRQDEGVQQPQAPALQQPQRRAYTPSTAITPANQQVAQQLALSNKYSLQNNPFANGK